MVSKILKTNVVYHGDCVKVLADRARFPSATVDLVVTSPPYGVRRNRTYGGIDPDKYVEWFLPISAELYRVLKLKGSFILNMKEGSRNCERETYVYNLVLAIKQQGWYWIEEYCWYKKNSFPGKWRHRFRDSWERCFHFSKSKSFKMYQDAVKVPIGNWSKERFRSMSEKDLVRSISSTNSEFGRKVANWLGRRKVYPHNVIVFESEHRATPSNLLHFSTECNNRSHSAAFPIELPSWFIKLFTIKDDVVLDPFMGSGATGVASLLMGRKYVGIEKYDEHVSLARKNLASAGRLIRAGS